MIKTTMKGLSLYFFVISTFSSTQGFTAFPSKNSLNPPIRPIGGSVGGSPPPGASPITVTPLPPPPMPPKRVGGGGGGSTNQFKSHTETKSATEQSTKFEMCTSTQTAMTTARAKRTSGAISKSWSAKGHGISVTAKASRSGVGVGIGRGIGTGTATKSASVTRSATRSATATDANQSVARSKASAAATRSAKQAAAGAAANAAKKECQLRAVNAAKQDAERKADQNAKRDAERKAAQNAQKDANDRATDAARKLAEKRLDELIAISKTINKKFLARVKSKGAPYPLRKESPWDKALSRKVPEILVNANLELEHFNQIARQMDLSPGVGRSLINKLDRLGSKSQRYFPPLTKEEQALVSALEFPSLRNGKLVLYNSKAQLPKELLMIQEISGRVIPGFTNYGIIVEAGLLNVPIIELNQNDWNDYQKHMIAIGEDDSFNPDDPGRYQMTTLTGKMGDSAVSGLIVLGPKGHNLNAVRIHEGFHAGLGLIIGEGFHQDTLRLFAPKEDRLEHGENGKRISNISESFRKLEMEFGGHKPIDPNEDYFGPVEESLNQFYGGIVMDYLINKLRVARTFSKHQDKGYADIANNLNLGLQGTYGTDIDHFSLKRKDDEVRESMVKEILKGKDIQLLLEDLAEEAQDAHRGLAPLGPVISDKGIGQTLTNFTINVLEYFKSYAK